MSKIVTITLNPSIDISTNFNGLVAEQKLRCQPPRFDAGGGGINVSKAIKKLGGKTTALFLSGGLTGVHFEELIQNLDLNYKKIEIAGSTRQNFTGFDNATNAQYRFTFTGPEISEAEAQKTLTELEQLNPDYVVASGSLPLGISQDFYAKVAALSKKLSARFILDTSNKELELAVNEGVFLLKPNIGELAKLVGETELELNQVDDASKMIIAKGGCEMIVVSLGPQGAIFTTKDICKHIPAPVIQTKTTVGAGDSMVGAMTYSLSKNEGIENAVKMGIACGSAATLNPGTQLFNMKDVNKIKDWIEKHGEKYAIKNL